MKVAIILDDTLGPGLLANSAACIASGLFNGAEDVLGPEIEGYFFKYIPITKIPILIMKQHNRTWPELLKRAKKFNLKYMVFTTEGQSTTSYEEYIERVKGKPIEEVKVIGIGAIGQDSDIQRFCGDLPLLK